MDRDGFWRLVDRIRANSASNDEFCEQARRELRGLSLNEVASYQGGVRLDRSSPPQPTGAEWDEASVALLYPGLAARFGYADASEPVAPPLTTDRKSWWKFW